MTLPVSTRLALSISTLALNAGAPALAAEIEAKSRVDAVVVYPDAALVTRVLDIDLPAGASTLVVRGLPASVDPASLRVAGAAAGQVAIGSVETRLAPAAEPARDSAIEAKLRKLRGDREAWQATLDALEAKKAMMIRFSQAGPEKLSPDSKPLDIAQWSAAWDTVGQGLAKIGDELVAARGRARDIDEEIRGLEQTRQRPPSVRPPSRDALVAIDATTAAKGSLSLTYRVAGAGWSPVYDARLDTADGARASLELVRRAAVTQRTGEDWTGVTLSVSTTRATRGAQARLELALTPEGGDADARADAIARLFITQAPNLRALADTDAHATVDRDVSVTSFDEVVFSHPGFAAVLRHRLAHRLHSLELPLLARIVAEDARARTGIYIHPGARIGERFVIRYGAGVVIGETAVIGRNVSLYQAVTLGAKSFDIDDALAPSREPRPRDPIVEDDVVIYAGATVLGRVTIGKGASIGGNVWLTDSVGPGSRIAQAKARNGSIA